MSVQAPLQRDVDLRDQNERLKTGLEAATLDVQNLQADLLAKGREITRLQRELAKMENRHVPTRDLEAVFDHFIATVWTGRGRRPKLDGARQSLIRNRLKDGFSVEDLKLALNGLAQFPNVGDQGRCGSASGKRYADLKHALRDAATVERFIDYLESPPERPKVVPLRRSPIREVEPRTGEALVDALVDLGLSVHVRHGYGAQARWMAQCPAHDDRNPSLSITENADGSLILYCFAGCTGGGLERNDPTPVLEAIGWTLPMIRGRK